MIAAEKFHVAMQLLKTTNLSKREISRRLGIGRYTVQRIAKGERPDYQKTLAHKQPAEFKRRDGNKPRRPVRHTCGNLVYLPCHICNVSGLIDEGLVPGCPGPHADHAGNPVARA